MLKKRYAVIIFLLVSILLFSVIASAYNPVKAGISKLNKAKIAGKATASKDSTSKMKARTINARAISDASGKGIMSKFVGKLKAQPIKRMAAKRVIGVKALDDAMAPRVR